MLPLLEYLKGREACLDIDDTEANFCWVRSKEILKQIVSKSTGWESSMPEMIANEIKEKGLFLTSKEQK